MSYIFMGVEVNCAVQFSLFLQMLLKVKESEVEYLHNEIGCLRKEVQVLIKVLHLLITHTSASLFLTINI